jgi:hypothetical protein
MSTFDASRLCSTNDPGIGVAHVLLSANLVRLPQVRTLWRRAQRQGVREAVLGAQEVGRLDTKDPQSGARRFQQATQRGGDGAGEAGR